MTTPNLQNPFLVNQTDPLPTNTMPQAEEHDPKEPKATKVFGIPLPDQSGPERVYRYDKGGYSLTDPAKNTKSSTKVTLLLDSTLSNGLNDIRGLAKISSRDMLRSVVNDPSYLQSLETSSPDDMVEDIANTYQSRGVAGRAAEVAEAITAWINAYDYHGVDIAEMPEQIQPYVKAYDIVLRKYRLTFNENLTNRLITRAGEDGVTPEDGQYTVSNTHRVYTGPDGETISLHLTTSPHWERRLPGFAANAGFASQSHRILGKGAKSGWAEKDLSDAKWQDAKFGVLVLPRTLDESGRAEGHIVGLDKGQCQDMADVAKTLYNVNQAHADKVVDSKLISGVNPAILEELDKANDWVEMATLWEKHKDIWVDEYTVHGQDRLHHLASQ